MNTQDIIKRLLEIHKEFSPDTMTEEAMDRAHAQGYADPCGCSICVLMDDLSGDECADVYACFELNDYDAPVLRAIKSFDRAMTWRDQDLLNRYYVAFALDAEQIEFPPRDLFEWARQNTNTDGQS